MTTGIMDRKEFKEIIGRVRKMAYADNSINQAIKEVEERAIRDKRAKRYISEPKMYKMLDDKISSQVADIASRLNISWGEIVEIYSETGMDFDKVDSLKKRNAVEGVFFSLIQVNFIESITNELISKAQ